MFHRWKKITKLVVLGIVLCPILAHAFTPIAGPQPVPASGTLQVVSTFSVILIDSQGNELPGQTLDFTAAQADAKVVTSPQYVKIRFSDNHTGFKSVIISTDNRSSSASPRFSPQFRLATGAGLVGKSEIADANTNHGAHAGDKVTAAPLHWTVFPNTSQANAYTMVADPTKEFFVIDKQQKKASELDLDPQKPGIQPPPAFEDIVGSALVVGGISGQTAFLADAPVNDGHGNHRTITNGKVIVKLAVNYTDQVGQKYNTNTLTFELISQ